MSGCTANVQILRLALAMLECSTVTSLASLAHETSLRGTCVLECLTELDRWCVDHSASFGITGSALLNSEHPSNDIDLVLVVPDDFLRMGEAIDALPRQFASLAWNSYLALFGEGGVHLYVTYCPSDTKIRLEMYPASTARRILALNQFEVRRLGENPLSAVTRVFRGTDGTFKLVPAVFESTEAGHLGEFTSCIWQGIVLYVGVHLERLLLACLVRDNLRIDSFRTQAWAALSQVAHQASLPLNGEVEHLFVLSDRLPALGKLRLRKLLTKVH
jgi:hypothetical protein